MWFEQQVESDVGLGETLVQVPLAEVAADPGFSSQRCSEILPFSVHDRKLSYLVTRLPKVTTIQGTYWGTSVCFMRLSA